MSTKVNPRFKCTTCENFSSGNLLEVQLIIIPELKENTVKNNITISQCTECFQEYGKLLIILQFNETGDDFVAVCLKQKSGKVKVITLESVSVIEG